MGQYWHIVNIDKRCQLRNRGGVKLWEILVNGEAELLVDLLQVPQWKGFQVSSADIAAAKAKW